MLNQTFTGVTAPQRELLECWTKLTDNSHACARHSDLDAGMMRAHLADISIISVPAPDAATVRLAGANVRGRLGQDPRGCSLSDIPAPVATTLERGIDDVIAVGTPLGGIQQMGEDGERHAWLRLPLLDAMGRMTLVLCHDQFLAKETTVPKSDGHDTIHGPEVPIAA